METTAAAMAYVALMLTNPVPVAECQALQEKYPQTLCVAAEEPCGKGAAEKCHGEVDMKPDKPVKRTYRKRYVRR